MKIVFSLLGIGIVALWLWGGGLAELNKDNGKNVESIEALFTGLAFLGMMVAIYFQKEELKLQREELADTREELRRSAAANEQSAQLAKVNIEQQMQISRMQNSYSKNSILAKKYVAQLDNIYKRIDIDSGNSMSPRIRRYQDERQNIENILQKLENLKFIDG